MYGSLVSHLPSALIAFAAIGLPFAWAWRHPSDFLSPRGRSTSRVAPQRYDAQASPTTRSAVNRCRFPRPSTTLYDQDAVK